MARFRFSLILIAACCTVAAPVLLANWQLDDVPVCTHPAVQQWPAAAPDGSGGTLVAWHDGRTSCIYAQRMDAEGVPLWGPDGVPAGRATFASLKPQITGDGFGGAYVLFERDSLYACWDMGLGPCLYLCKVFVSKLSADGSILWQKRLHIPPAPDGFVTDEAPRMRPDGEGGVVVAWRATNQLQCYPPCVECGCEWVNYDVLAQRIDGTGAFLWGEAHVKLFDNAGYSNAPNPRIVADGAGGFVVTFERSSGYNTGAVYAQRVSGGGELLWGPTGVVVFATAGYPSNPVIAADGYGGSFVAWSGGGTSPGIYAQRLDAAGCLLWPPAGVPVCVASGSREGLRIVPGAPGNVILSWKETRGGIQSIYAQRLDPAGQAVWTPDGMPLNAPGPECVEPVQAADGTGGSIVSWVELPAGYGDALRGIWGDASGPLFAAGDRGLICRIENGELSPMPTPTEATLRGLWGSSSSDVFAVGLEGTILHYDGVSWNEMTSGTAYDLYGIWGTGPDDVYAVGGRGTVLHYDGSAWNSMDYSGEGSFYGISGTSSTNIYIVGMTRYHGLIVRYNGSTWSETANCCYILYTGVWVSPDNQVFAAGVLVSDVSIVEGIIRYNTGGGWITLPLGISSGGWCSVWGDVASNVYVLLANGYLLRFDGAGWSSPEHISAYPMYDLWGTAGSDVYAAGRRRAIIHQEGSAWETVAGSTGVLMAQRIDSTGTGLWMSNGAQITLSGEEEREPTLAVDEDGFATFAWKDSRGANWDIYSRRVSIARGPIVGTLLASYAATPVRGGIAVHWELTEYDGEDLFLISRSGGSGEPAWRGIEPSIRRVGLSFDFVDFYGEPGLMYRYRVEREGEDGTSLLFETEAVEMPPLPLTLYQNVPNPFNPSTAIRYYLPAAGRITLSVYDVAGRHVRRLVDRTQPAGMHEVTWDGTDANGRCASGVYFYRLETGKQAISKKMVLLR